MQILELLVDGRSAVSTPGPRSNQGEVLVPVHAFGKAIGAEVKLLGAGNQLAVCQEDLCVPVLTDISVEETVYAPLVDLAEPLGLKWEVAGKVLKISTAGKTLTGLGIGKRPPAFELPDLYTGEPVSLRDYRGKKAIFYMWASW